MPMVHNLLRIRLSRFIYGISIAVIFYAYICINLSNRRLCLELDNSLKATSKMVDIQKEALQNTDNDLEKDFSNVPSDIYSEDQASYFLSQDELSKRQEDFKEELNVVRNIYYGATYDLKKGVLMNNISGSQIYNDSNSNLKEKQYFMQQDNINNGLTEIEDEDVEFNGIDECCKENCPYAFPDQKNLADLKKIFGDESNKLTQKSSEESNYQKPTRLAEHRNKTGDFAEKQTKTDIFSNINDHLRNFNKICSKGNEGYCRQILGQFYGLKTASDISNEKSNAITDIWGNNYASLELGASICSVIAEPLNRPNIVQEIFGLKYISNMPLLMLEQSVRLGNCFAFVPPRAVVVVKLADEIFIRKMVIEHIPRALVSCIKNAPKDFKLYAMPLDNYAAEYFLGEFTFQLESGLGKQLQVFDTKHFDKKFGYIKIIFQSNHGNPENTCVYRIGVFSGEF